MLRTNFTIEINKRNGEFEATIPQLNYSIFRAETVIELEDIVKRYILEFEELPAEKLDINFIEC